MASPQKHALTLIADPALSTSGGQLAALQRAVLEQLALIKRMEGEAALRGVIAGIGFIRVKNSLERGQFRPWIEAEGGIGKSQVSNLMRLAMVFLERSRMTKTELLALGSSSELATPDENARRFMEKAHAFVGECSLNELLVKYGIKGVSREGDAGEDNGGEPDAGDDGQMWLSEISGHLYGFRTSVLKEEAIVRLPPEQLRTILAEHDAQNAELHALAAKALGK